MSLSRNKKIFIIVGVVCSILIILWFIFVSINSFSTRPGNTSITPTLVPIPSKFQNSPPRITGTDPRENQNNADYTGTITIKFDSVVKPEWFIFTLNPQMSGTLKQLSRDTLEFTPTSHLKSNTKYDATIILRSGPIISPRNTKVDRYIWSFTTDQVTGEESFTQKDKQSFQTIRETAEKAYTERKQRFPFITQLPKQTMHYKVEISSSNVVIITTYGKSAYEAQLAQQDARDWLKSTGSNPETLNIQYITQ